MTLVNIVDNRKRRYRWKNVTAIIEPTIHDNAVHDSDQIGPGGAYEGIGYAERANISVGGAVKWAMKHDWACTLYLYDLGEGTKVV